ncbi:MAG: hypothetical protein IPI67_27190 [Myxococcales bacterium]|nr:hypothetical protein [Myxococcales bacterium]
MSFRSVSSWALALALFLPAGLGGCPPGTLDDPDRFLTASMDGGPTCPPGFDVERDLFPKACGSSLCHDEVDGGGGLDLVSKNVAARVVDVPSTATDCAGRLMVDSADPTNSYFLEKVTKKVPECGDRMPPGPKPLSATEVECIKLWLYTLVGTGADGGGVDSGSDDAGGGG